MSDKVPEHYRFPGFMPWIKYRGPLLAFMMLSCVAFWVVILVAMAVTGEPVRVVFGLYSIAIICSVVFLFFVFTEVLDVWTSPYLERQWLAAQERFRNLAKEPFHGEQRCKVSATEEVWVRHFSMTDTNARPMPALEVLHSKDGGRTWETLPLQLSPWARFACTVLDAKWPPYSGSRNLACNNCRVSFEMVGRKWFEKPWRFLNVDPEDIWLSIWRATYDPRRKWWTLKLIGQLGLDWIDRSK